MSKRKPAQKPPHGPRARATPQRSGPHRSAGTRSAARPGGGESTWLWGSHAVLAALANPRRQCHRLILAQESAEGWQSRLAPLLADRSDLPQGAERLERAEMARLLGRQAVHQGLAVLAEPLAQPGLEALLQDLLAHDRTALVVLDQVSDPHNVGAVLRSAAAFGAGGVVTTRRHAPGETGALAKTASGALEAVPFVHVTNLARALDSIAEAGFRLLGLSAGGEVALQAESDSPRTAIVLGAEGSGLRRLTAAHCDRLVCLPTGGPVGELNVSNAAAVALYELLGRSRVGAAEPGRSEA